MHSVHCWATCHSVHYIKILNVAQHCFYGIFVLPAKIKIHIGLAEQIVVIDKSLCYLSVFVSVARKHFTRLDGINQLCSSEY